MNVNGGFKPALIWNKEIQVPAGISIPLILFKNLILENN